MQADLATTLQTLADAASGAPDRVLGIRAARDEFYLGVLGDRVVAATREGGGTFTAADMSRVSAALTDTISVEYSGYTIHQSPPPSQGITMLIALNILASVEFAPDDQDSPETWHVMIEAMKLALADREAYVGDPAFVDVPVGALLDPAYGVRQRERIDPHASLSWPTAPGLGENTTTFQVVDADGNAITVTTSTGYQLIGAGDTGIFLNNRLQHMTIDDPSSPNFAEPGKLVRYTGLSPQEAISRYRFVSQSHPNGVVPHLIRNRVVMEDTAPAALVDALRARGQEIAIQGFAAEPFPFGFGSMIEVDDTGVVAIGTDPRIASSTGTLLLTGDGG